MNRPHPLIGRPAPETAGRSAFPGRCCARCKSPYFCANNSCPCHPEMEDN